MNISFIFVNIRKSNHLDIHEYKAYINQEQCSIHETSLHRPTTFVKIRLICMSIRLIFMDARVIFKSIRLIFMNTSLIFINITIFHEYETYIQHPYIRLIFMDISLRTSHEHTTYIQHTWMMILKTSSVDVHLSGLVVPHYLD